MRRIKSACLLQTIKFDTNSETDPKKDFEIYINKLERNKTKYVIEESKEETDGSLIVKIKKQYNSYSTDGYID